MSLVWGVHIVLCASMVMHAVMKIASICVIRKHWHRRPQQTAITEYIVRQLDNVSLPELAKRYSVFTPEHGGGKLRIHKHRTEYECIVTCDEFTSYDVMQSCETRTQKRWTYKIPRRYNHGVVHLSYETKVLGDTSSKPDNGSFLEAYRSTYRTVRSMREATSHELWGLWDCVRDAFDKTT